MGDSAFHAETKPDGSFEIAGVPEGEWRLTAETQAEGVTLRASEWIEVTRRNLDRLKPRLSPPITVNGKLIFETRQGMPTPPSPRFLLDEQHGGEAAFGGTSRAADADANGDFQFHNLYPGAYAFSPGPAAPAGYYLDSVQFGNAPAPAELEISAESPLLTVVYKSDGGSVHGTVEDCDEGEVLLVVADEAPVRIRRATCDAKSQFQFESVRPGEYSAVAVPGHRTFLNVEPGLLQNAARVTVHAGESTEADLRLTAAQ